MPIKSVKMKISKNKKMRFFLMSQWSLNPRIRFLGQKLWSVARVQTDGQTDRRTDGQTDTKVTTEGTLSWFQELILQPITKDRPNRNAWQLHFVLFLISYRLSSVMQSYTGDGCVYGLWNNNSRNVWWHDTVVWQFGRRRRLATRRQFLLAWWQFGKVSVQLQLCPH